MGEEQVDLCFKNHLVLEMSIYSPFNNQTWSLASESSIKGNILPQTSMQILKCLAVELCHVVNITYVPPWQPPASIIEANDRIHIGIFLNCKC